MKQEFGTYGDRLVRVFIFFARNHDLECINKLKVSDIRVRQIIGKKYKQYWEVETPYRGVRTYFLNGVWGKRSDSVDVYCCPCAQLYIERVLDQVRAAETILLPLWYHRDLLTDLALKEPDFFKVQKPLGTLHDHICNEKSHSDVHVLSNRH